LPPGVGFPVFLPESKKKPFKVLKKKNGQKNKKKKIGEEFVLFFFFCLLFPCFFSSNLKKKKKKKKNPPPTGGFLNPRDFKEKFLVGKIGGGILKLGANKKEKEIFFFFFSLKGSKKGLLFFPKIFPP